MQNITHTINKEVLSYLCAHDRPYRTYYTRTATIKGRRCVRNSDMATELAALNLTH